MAHTLLGGMITRLTTGLVAPEDPKTRPWPRPLCEGPRDMVADPEGLVFMTAEGHDGVFTIAPDGGIALLAGRAGQAPYAEPDEAAPPLLTGIARDGEGRIVVADYNGRRLMYLDAAAGALRPWPGPGTTALPVRPRKIVADGRGGFHVGGSDEALYHVDAQGVVLTPAPPPEAAWITGTADFSAAADGRLLVLRRDGQVLDAAGTPLRPAGWDEEEEADTCCAIAPGPGPGFTLLSRTGQLIGVGADGVARPVTSPRGWPVRLPSHAQLAPGPGGSLLVSCGYADEILAIAPDGDVQVLADDLGGVGPVASDGAGGALLIAGRQRIVQVAADGSRRVLHAVPNRPATDGQGPDARFARPTRLALAPDGTLYVLEREARRIRAIDPDGLVTTVLHGATGWGGNVADAVDLADLATDDEGRLYALDGAGGIHEVRAGGLSEVARCRRDGGPWPRHQHPRLETTGDGDFLVMVPRAARIWRVAPHAAGGRTACFAGSLRGTRDGPGLRARFDYPHAIARLPGGGFLVADTSRVARIDAQGHVETLAGTPTGWVGQWYQRGFTTWAIAPAPAGGFYAIPVTYEHPTDPEGERADPAQLVRVDPHVARPLTREDLSALIAGARADRGVEARDTWTYPGLDGFWGGFEDLVGRQFAGCRSQARGALARIVADGRALQLEDGPVRLTWHDTHPAALATTATDAQILERDRHWPWPIAAVELVASLDPRPALVATISFEQGWLRLDPLPPYDRDLDDPPHPFRAVDPLPGPWALGEPVRLGSWDALLGRRIDETRRADDGWHLAGRGWTARVELPADAPTPGEALGGALITGVEARIGADGWAAVTLTLDGHQALPLGPQARIREPRRGW